MAEESFTERTEQATPRRRLEARRKGQVAKSREIPAAAILLIGFSVLYLLSTHFYNCFSRLTINFLQKIEDFQLTPANLLHLQKYIWGVTLLHYGSYFFGHFSHRNYQQLRASGAYFLLGPNPA